MNNVPQGLVSFQADVVKALGHPLRIEIVNFLKARERSVSDIIEHFAADPSNVSRHLAILKRAGILGSKKSGLSVSYRVQMGCVSQFLTGLGSEVKRKFEH